MNARREIVKALEDIESTEFNNTDLNIIQPSYIINTLLDKEYITIQYDNITTEQNIGPFYENPSYKITDKGIAFLELSPKQQVKELNEAKSNQNAKDASAGWKDKLIYPLIVGIILLIIEWFINRR